MRLFRKNGGKKGVSPVIATVLLIALAIVLVSFVFIWAKNVIKERTEKFGEAVHLSCDDIDFVPEAESIGRINVNNVGNIPLYGIEVRKKGVGSIKNLGAGYFDNGLPKGAGKGVDIDLKNPGIGDEFIIVPIILGETDEYKKPYVCSDEFGKTAKVVA